jgi:2'-5' RNA ligase
VRLFVAVELDQEVRAHLGSVQSTMRGVCPGVRWVLPEQMHLTLKFLGEVADRRVAEVAAALERAAGGSRACTLTLRGCGCFPPGGAPRVVWVGVEEPTGALAECAAAVEGSLEDLGFPREQRPFSAHVTLGRVRDDAGGGALRSKVSATSAGPWTQPVERIVLMSSVLSPKGASHTPVAACTLGREGG